MNIPLNLIVVGTIGDSLNIDSEKLFINDSDGAHEYYLGLIEGLGWERDEEAYEDEDDDISDFLSNLEDENVFWLEYGITAEGQLWQPTPDA